MMSRSRELSFFAFSLAVLFLAMGIRLGPELADDGAFFLRYAQNMADGHFWVWNKGENPIWGASAPLYPLLIALPIKLGVAPITAMVGTGMVIGALALSFTAVLLYRNFNVIAGLAFIALAALDTGMMYFLGSGLETPLTIALLAFALYSLLSKEPSVLIGISAGLLGIQKLDLFPVAAFLLLACFIHHKRILLRPIVIAACIVFFWYGFAWWYFGAPVPNSFLTKALHQENQPKSIDWTWFGKFVFMGGMHYWLSLLSVAAIFNLIKKNLSLIVFLCGSLAVHLAAYTIKFPFEPYNWYCMPSVYVLLVLASIGLCTLNIKAFPPSRPALNYALRSAPIAVLVIIYVASLKTEINIRNSIISFSANQEFDRSEAGRWVGVNTPAHFKVFTLWGNPAYYSNREVIDASFLNRHYESGNLIDKYKPEILILQNNPGSIPMDPVFAFPGSERYKVVKTFDLTYSHSMDYFFSVLARADVIDQISNVEPPKNLMRYVSNIKLGDNFGIARPVDKRTIFVHPGASTPTALTFDSSKFFEDNDIQFFTIFVRIADNVPPDAIERGAAKMNVRILAGDSTVFEGTIDTNSSFKMRVTSKQSESLQFIVDNKGNPDTDWLLISIE